MADEFGLYDPPMSVAGKTAIVTGAGTGIGRATALKLASIALIIAGVIGLNLTGAH